ncbi:mitochondrial import inner membrane translocase subunit Tim21 [Lepisosteus oculatus]|uniref:mitochondrial import inner membrane translocase subunit Tim21 n=1 Tax=Lepisosteus oculatus TaxID=7918 RepID=UPI003719BFBE
MLFYLILKSQQVRSARCCGFRCYRQLHRDGGSLQRASPTAAVRSVCAAGLRSALHVPKLGVLADPGLRRGKHESSGQLPAQGRRGDTSTLSTAQKVKKAGKDFTYLIVVLVGIGVTGGLFYVVFKELFSSSSPSKIYGKALEKCRAHPEIVGVFGEPIRGYGETTRRGRRQHVSHMEYMKDGVKHMRLKFYIDGAEPRLQGTAHAEVLENPKTGKYEFRYLFVDVDTYPRRTIVVEDNR